MILTKCKFMVHYLDDFLFSAQISDGFHVYCLNIINLQYFCCFLELLKNS